jgi:hypothetical protein
MICKEQDMSEQEVLTIDDKKYNVADLSEEARTQVTNLRFTDAEIQRTKAQLAVFNTARASYAAKLKEELDKLAPVN